MTEPASSTRARPGTTPGMDSFYRPTLNDASRAGEAMADAFAHDPLWLKIFEGDPDVPRRLQACLEIPIRHCLKYGEVYATSRNLEGIAAAVPARFSDMAFWRMVRSGALGCGMRMGTTAARRMADLKILSKDRARIMAGRPYLYLLALGVRTAHQGRGLGGLLLRELTADCDRRGLPIYLETETEENVRFYERAGFEVIEQIELERLHIPMWEMMRQPWT